MFRKYILILIGGLGLSVAPPLSAQEGGCCADKQVACCDEESRATATAGEACCKEGTATAASLASQEPQDGTTAQDEPSEIAKGLAKLAQNPFKFDVDVAMTAPEGANASIVGSVAWGDLKHFALNLKLVAKESAEAESQTSKIRMVADGTWMYWHVDSPELPAEMAQFAFAKVNLSMMDQLKQAVTSQAPVKILNDEGKVSASAIDEGLKQANLKITRDAEKGLVTLSMDMPGATPEQAGTMSISLDGKSYLPKVMTMKQGKEMNMTATFKNAAIMKDLAAFGEKAWAFAVPEGTVVMDVTPMLQMAMAQMGGGGAVEEDELEF